LKDDHRTLTPLTDGYYLTDGGLETALIFHHGIELPHFAAFALLNHPDGRRALSDYYRPYLDIARTYDLNFVLETPTWRANRDWGYKLGYGDRDLKEINRKAVAFVRGLKSANEEGSSHIALSGNIGPRGDGYAVEKAMTPEEAKAYHFPQIKTFFEEGVDLVTALTINYTDEAVGIVLAAQEVDVPCVISFTVETNGRLPGGETLQEAIERTDRLTDSFASHFMINCAHPEHFEGVLSEEGLWKRRIRGIRANASTKSHKELDESQTLDSGDRELLAAGYQEIMQLLPEVKVFGGCCGTDHSHIDLICGSLFPR
jgi:S-methylmethionine-dependent homocysteine/selenocysteine methylase